MKQHAGNHEKAYCVGDPRELKYTLHSECDRMAGFLGRKELFFVTDLYSGSSRTEKCLFSPDRVYMTEQNRGRHPLKSLSLGSLAVVCVTLNSCVPKCLEFLASLAAAAQVWLGEGPCKKCNFLNFVSLEFVSLFISLF